MKLISIILLLLTDYGSCQQAFRFNYIVDSTKNSSCAVQSETDYYSSYTCGSLMEAILGSRSSSGSNTIISFKILDNSSHTISNNPILTFINRKEVTFFGSGTQIICRPQSGLYFENIVTLVISNLTLTNCSTERNSTYTNLQTGKLATYLAAVIFSVVTNLNLSNLNISTSAGETAVALYNVPSAVVSHCIFNSSHDKNQADGWSSTMSAAVLVELTYCQSYGEIVGQCTNMNDANGYIFNMSHSRILHHTAISAEEDLFSFNPHPNGANYNSAGKGGGMAILVKGNCISNSINIEHVEFTGNKAIRGSALYISFMDIVSYNSVIVTNSKFEGNGESTNESEDTSAIYKAGGAIAIDNWATPRSFNRVNILNSQFEHNTAQMGGAFFLNSLYSTSTIEMMINNSCLNGNKARVGSALYTLVSQANMPGDNLNFTVHNTSFTSNIVVSHGQVSSSGYGTVYSHMVGITFSRVLFTGNNGTALVMIDSCARFADRTEFYENIGFQGGAVSLLGSSYINLASGAMLNFSDNRAMYQGGAIFKRYLEHVVPGSQFTPCFFQYEIPNTHPTEWNVKISFSNNLAFNNKSNSIHATSLLPCETENVNLIFEHQWIYSETEISSRATTDFASYKHFNLTIPNAISPGRHFNVQIDLQDEFNQTINTTHKNFIVKLENSTILTSLDRMLVNGAVNECSHLVMDSIEKPGLHVEFDFPLSECPLGFYNMDSQSCSCYSSQEIKNFINCTNDKHVAVLHDNGWLGNYSNEIYVAPCPLYYCKTYTSGLELPHTYTADLSSFICTGNRTGLLCSQCIEGFNPAINSWKLECVECADVDDSQKVPIYMSVVYIPYAVMMLVIIIFNIQLSAGPPSTLVMFSQMVTTTFDASIHGLVKIYPEKALNTYRYVYGPLNLDFIDNIIPPFCFASYHSILDVVSLNYFLVVIPMVIILVSILLKVVIGKKTRIVIKPVQKFWKVLKSSKLFKSAPKNFSEGVILATSTVVSLSFLKICFITSMVMNTMYLRSINNNESKPQVVTFDATLPTDSSHYRTHLAFAVIFQLLALSFIILLLDYPLRLVEYCIHKSNWVTSLYPETTVHSFLSSFNWPYKKPYKLFAGLNFFMRFFFAEMFVYQASNYTKFTLQSMSCFVMILLIFFCWPYKNVKHNYIDLFLISNLLILNALGFYQYVAFFLSPRHKRLTKFIFAVQYIFIVAPLTCLVAYILYRVTQHKHDKWREDVQYTLSGLLKKWSPQLHRKMTSAINEEHSRQEEDIQAPSSSRTSCKASRRLTSPISRRTLNSGATPLHWSVSDEVEVDGAATNVPVTVIGVEDKNEGEATTYQTCQSEGYFLRSEWNPTQYGSINQSFDKRRQKARK